MAGPAFTFLVFFAMTTIALLGLWLWRSLRPVERIEVERFARLADLPVSTRNGERIVDAIAGTRFWRVIGVTTALLLSALMTIWAAVRTNQLSLQLIVLLVLLAGYYAGSVVAEYRTAHRTYGQEARVASLRRRLLSDYIDSWAVRWPRALAIAGIVGAVVSLVATPHLNWGVVAGIGAFVIAVVTAVVSRHIVERPAAIESAELMATDSAIRSRSLHALTGATVAIQIWLVSITALYTITSVADKAGVKSGGLVLFLVLFILGLVIPIRGLFIGRKFMRRPFAVQVLDPVEP